MYSSIFSQKSVSIVQPGRYLDWYPESLDNDPDWSQRLLSKFERRNHANIKLFRKFGKTAQLIEQKVGEYSSLDKSKREELQRQLQVDLRQAGFKKRNLIRAFALINVEIKQIYGFSLHQEQLFCAWVLLHGQLAEMATGEGKSITAALTAAVAALAGAPVHVITTNDYLVERDATSMQPLFEQFGLTCSFVSASLEEDERRQAYAQSICYVSNKQLVFDYLRDRQQLGNRPSSISTRVQELCRMQPPQPLLRGLCFAIVDEADSVLIDDAITPLILSQQLQGDAEISQSLTAISLARRLKQEEDFKVDNRNKRVIISEQGEHQLADLSSGLDGVWKNRRFRHELVRQALSSIYLFERDRDYIVRDGEVLLIDQSTGRVMPDRKLQHGLHQMLETKEKCELTGQSETIASLSFQNFFKRYKHLCGMTGTAQEAKAELKRAYNLPVVCVPTHQKSRRVKQLPLFASDETEHQKLLIAEIEECHSSGQPVLVGTRSLAQSERISDSLTAINMHHQVLNARQDEHEAEVVAQAGAKNAVTIATNIAGRGTDIPVTKEVRTLGGLHVIIAELNDNQRIDRQLIGRGARQGDPGSFKYIISLTDELLIRYLPEWMLNLLKRSFFRNTPIWPLVCKLIAGFVQAMHEHQQRIIRKQVALNDKEMNKKLSFSGYKE